MNRRRDVFFRQWLPFAVAAICLAVMPGRAVFAIDALRFDDGQWYGSLTGGGLVQFDKAGSHTEFNSNWLGSFSLSVDSGVITDGQWSMSGLGTTRVQAGGQTTTGHVTLNWAGQPGGDASAPVLDGVASMHMTVTGQSFDLTLTRDQTADPVLEIYTANCSQVTGDWTAGISNGIQDNEGQANITGPFAAYNATSSQISHDAVRRFFANFATYLEHLGAGSFRRPELTALILQAELFEGLLRETPTCSLPDAESGSFALMIYALMLDTLGEALAHPDAWDTSDLVFLTRAAIRSGVLGAGAPDQTTARQSEDGLMAIFDARLTRAIADGDRLEAQEILELAVQMSWAEISTKALLWLSGA